MDPPGTLHPRRLKQSFVSFRRPSLPEANVREGRVRRIPGAEVALDQTNRLDGHRPHLGVTIPEEPLDPVFPPGVVHPGERDMRREVVILGIEPHLRCPGLDRLVESCQFLAPSADPEPHDTDVLPGGKRPDSLDRRLEGVDPRFLDRLADCLLDRSESLLRHLAEKFQRDVGL